MSTFIPVGNVVAIATATTFANTRIATSGVTSFQIDAVTEPAYVGISTSSTVAPACTFVPIGVTKTITCITPNRAPGNVYVYAASTTSTGTVFVTPGIDTSY